MKDVTLNKVKASNKFRKFIFIFLIYGMFLWLWMCNFDYTNVIAKETFPCSFFVLLVFGLLFLLALFYPLMLLNIFDLFLKKKREDILGAFPQDEEGEDWKENIQLPKEDLRKKLEDTLSINKDYCFELKDKDVEELESELKEQKYDLVIRKIKNILLTNKDIQIQKEIIIRSILDASFSFYDCDDYLSDRKENLEKLINILENKRCRSCSVCSIELFFRYNLITVFCMLGKYDEALSMNIKLLRSIKNNDQVDVKLLYNSLYLQAKIYIQKNKFIYAIGYFNAACDYTKDDGVINANTALIYFYELSNVNKCLEYAERALVSSSLDDKTFRLAISMSYHCYALNKDFKKAYDIMCNYEIQCNNDLLEVPIEMLANKSYIAYKLEKFEEATDLVANVLDTDAKNDTAINVKAMLQLKDGKYECSFRNFDSIVKNFEDSNNKSLARYYTGEIYYNMSIACLKMEKNNEAKKYFNKALEIGFDDFDPRYIVDLDDIYENLPEK